MKSKKSYRTQDLFAHLIKWLIRSSRKTAVVGKTKGFTLIELLVVIAIIALLMSILMPALTKARKQAKTVACQSSLHQWAIFWSMYTSDNDGNFHDDAGGESSTSANRWPSTLRSLYSNIDMRLCPMATKPETEGGIHPFAAWGKYSDGTFGSYGFNEWLSKRTTIESYDRQYIGNYFGNVNAKPANNIPVFLDCALYDVWPFDVDLPPPADGPAGLVNCAGRNEMRRVCINRHNGFVNSVFLDWSIRKVGLKELWTLKWHKTFKTVNNYTKAGGATASTWPEWMRDFKDY
jgi:prepilin-type N-terminal cleavage/methylation domain-containing protein